MLSDSDRLTALLMAEAGQFMKNGRLNCTKLAENLIANGVIVPPCNVGDIVYAKYSGTNEIEYYIVDEVIHLGSDNFEFKAHLENEDGYIVDNIDFGVPNMGLTVFPTCEEAEKALERSEG